MVDTPSTIILLGFLHLPRLLPYRVHSLRCLAVEHSVRNFFDSWYGLASCYQFNNAVKTQWIRSWGFTEVACRRLRSVEEGGGYRCGLLGHSVVYQCILIESLPGMPLLVGIKVDLYITFPTEAISCMPLSTAKSVACRE